MLIKFICLQIVEIFILQETWSRQWSLNQGARALEALAPIQMILRMPEEEGSMIDRRLQDETDIAGLALETEDLVRAPEIEDGRTRADRKIGNSQLLHLRPKVLYPIRTILLVMFQRYIINTRYKQLCKFDRLSLFYEQSTTLCLINYINWLCCIFCILLCVSLI